MKINSCYRLLALLVGVVMVGGQVVWAADLDSAKSEGLIGELPNGYLGLVVDSAPADVKALVSDINQKRKEKYQEVAHSRSIGLEQVEEIAGKKAIEKTEPNHFVMINGQWVKK